MNNEERNIVAKLVVDVEFLRGRLAVSDMVVDAMARMMPPEFCVIMRNILTTGLSRTDQEISGVSEVETVMPDLYPARWREAAQQKISVLEGIIAERP